MSIDYFEFAKDLIRAQAELFLSELPRAAPLLADREITIDVQRPGHAHIYREGRCGAGVTVADIKQRFYDPYFGGRDATVVGGWWRAVEHTD